jgi:hypothetical protein
MPRGLSFPIVAADTPIPAYARGYLVFPAPTSGVVTVTPAPTIVGSRFVVPAGTSGVVRLPWGANHIPGHVMATNSADWAIGAVVALELAHPDHIPLAEISIPQPANLGIRFVDNPDGKTTRAEPLQYALNGVNVASWLRTPNGGLGSASLSGALVVIPGDPLLGALTISSPSGFSQVVPPGSQGVIALTGPTGAAARWSFANAADTYASGAFITGSLS